MIEVEGKLVKRYYIRCDLCGRRLGPELSEEIILMLAKSYLWRIKGSKHYCPRGYCKE
jgi:hypothetical protein